MAWSLATYLDRLSSLLNDATQLSFSTAALTDALRQALHEYSTQLPIEQQTTLTLTSDRREIDVSSIADLVNVTEVWLPYAADDDTYPAYHRKFRYWPDLKTVYLTNGDPPASGDTVRIFYTQQHTINGLDAAAITSVPDVHAWLIVRGAAAIAVNSLALTDGQRRIQDWADKQYHLFTANLAVIARIGQGDPFARQPNLDRYERDWG